MGEYLELLRDARRGPTELELLAHALTVGETYFFRHTELFTALEEVVLPECLERNRWSRRLRLWSAACSTGAEPYSLSILLRRELREPSRGYHFEIAGTDLNTRFLAQAREGSYGDWDIRGESRPVADCFEQEGDRLRLLPRFREGVVFHGHNLAVDEIPCPELGLAGLDLVLCRNVLIYFDEELVERTVARLREALSPGGWLALGHAESHARSYEGLELVPVEGAALYRRVGAARSSAGPGQASPPRVPAGDAGRGAPGPGRERDPATRLYEEIAVQADRGHLADALQLCDRGLACSPRDPRLGLTRAVLLLENGRLPEAERALRRVLDLDRTAALGHYHLGVVLQRMRRPQDSRRAFECARSLLVDRPADESVDPAQDLTAGRLLRLIDAQLSAPGRP